MKNSTTLVPFEEDPLFDNPDFNTEEILKTIENKDNSIQTQTGSSISTMTTASVVQRHNCVEKSTNTHLS